MSTGDSYGPRTDASSWGSYERLVLSKLDELSEDVKEIQQEQGRQRIDIAMLKVRSGVWGAAAGLVPFGLYVAYALLGGQA
jgi:hypothetical protein